MGIGAYAEERRRYEYSRQIKELEMLRMRSSMHNNIPYSYPEDMSDLGRTQYYDRQIENIKRMRGY